MIREYRTISKIEGSLIVVENVRDVVCGELAELVLPGGGVQSCRVLEIDGSSAVLQVFDNTAGIGLKTPKVRFTGRPPELAVSEDMLGRIFNGMGDPIDNYADVLAASYKDIEGLPVNPAGRACPNDFIQTGISAIDGLCTLVLGRTLPIFSGHGLPHARLASQIVRQARVPGSDDFFTIVFASIGLTYEDSEYYVQEFNRIGIFDRCVFFINRAGDPVMQRIAAPRMALTAAEYLAFEKDMHVLVILSDMTNYAEAQRELSAARKEAPERLGYSGRLYTDLASLFERAGIRSGKSGSITMIPILTMPGNDITHPIPDLTGCLADGRIVLSRDLYNKGSYPPVDACASLAHHRSKNAGKGKARADHAGLSDLLLAAYSRGRSTKKLLPTLGYGALTDDDRLFVRFSDEFETRYISQGDKENRTIEETLALGWELLSILPKAELKRVDSEFIEKYLPRG